IVVRSTAADDWTLPAGSEELLWARRVNDDGFEILSIPFFAKNVSLGDVVAIRPDDAGVPMFDRVLRSGGHSTYRVAVDEATARRRHDDYHALLDALRTI